MSIFSSIGSAIGSAYNYVSGFFGGGNNTASAANSVVQGPAAANIFGSPAYNAQNAKQGLQPAYGPTSAYGTPAPAIKLPGNALASAPQLPVNISAGAQKPMGGASGSWIPSSISTGNTPTATSTQSRTISSGSLAGGSNFASIQSAPGIGSSGGGSQPISLSSAPTVTNPGTVDTTKLAGALAGYYTRNNDGTYIPATQQSGNTSSNNSNQSNNDALSVYDKYFPTKDNVYADPEVAAARAKRDEIQQSLQAPTAELNAIVAKQNQDLLQLRQTGSQEGVTEAVYGGQSSAINYNAAIRALPLQATIAGLQGNLKLAQDFLSEVTQVKKEQIDTQYQANVAHFDAIKDYINKKDERAYDELKTANANAHADQNKLLELQNTLSQNAMANGHGELVSAIHNAKDSQSAMNAAGAAGIDPYKKAQTASLIASANAKTPVVNEDGTQNYSTIDISRYGRAANSIVKNFIDLPQYKLTANGLPYLQRIQAADSIPGSVSDAELLDSIVKLNTGGNQVTEAQVKLITGGKSYSDAVNVFQNKFANGGVLSDTQRSQLTQLATKVFDRYRADYQPVYDKATSQLRAAGIPEAFWTIPDLNRLSGQSTGSDTVAPEIQSLRDKYGY